MSHSVSAPCVVFILAMSTIGLIESKPVGLSHQRNHGQGHDLPPSNQHPILNHGQGHDLPPSNQHPILYIQINDDGNVNKSQHQNDYTLMDIAYTKTGILIKGRKSARYLCMHPNKTLYSTVTVHGTTEFHRIKFQLTENCKFKEGRANDHGNKEKHNFSPVEMHSKCLQSGQVNPNSPDPLAIVEC